MSSSPKIKLIAAMSANGVIGDGEKLLWFIPDDLKHFKSTTRNQVVIMGRKTFESIDRKPLSHRVNIVLSRKMGGDIVKMNMEDEVTTEIHMGDLTPAINLALNDYRDKDVYIIGGSEIYDQSIGLADELIISHVHAVYKGSCHFPYIDPRVWEITEVIENKFARIPFSIVTYSRITD